MKLRAALVAGLIFLAVRMLLVHAAAPRSHDDWVHYHRAEESAADGKLYALSGSFGFPYGIIIPWPLGYDVALGGVLKFFGARALMLTPLLAGALTAFVVVFGARRLGISPWGSAVFWSLLPAGVLVTMPGALDHRAWESAFFWSSILVFPSRPMLSGFLLGVAFHITPFAPVLAIVYLMALLGHALTAYARKRHAVGESIENAIFAASITALPASIEFVSLDAPSLLQVFGLAGAGFLLAAFFSGPVTRWSRFLIAACFLIAVGLPAWSMVRSPGIAELLMLMGAMNSDPWRALIFGIGWASVGWAAIPFVYRRIPAGLFIPSVAVFLLAVLRSESLHLAAVPAAWTAIVLVEKISLRSQGRLFVRGLVALALLLPIAAVFSNEDFPPRIPDSVVDLIQRSAKYFNRHSVLLAQPELAGHIVGLTDASTVADEFRRNRHGEEVWQSLFEKNDTDVAEILNAHRVTAILLTDASESKPGSFADILLRKGNRHWRLVEGDSAGGLYLLQ